MPAESLIDQEYEDRSAIIGDFVDEYMLKNKVIIGAGFNCSKTPPHTWYIHATVEKKKLLKELPEIFCGYKVVGKARSMPRLRISKAK